MFISSAHLHKQLALEGTACTVMHAVLWHIPLGEEPQPSPLQTSPPLVHSPPAQVSLADAEKRAKELSFQVKMLADVAGSPGVSVCTDRWGL